MPIIYNTLMFIAIWFIYEVFHFPTVSSFLYGEPINVFLTIVGPVAFTLTGLSAATVIFAILIPLVADGYTYNDPRNPFFIGRWVYMPSVLCLIAVNMRTVTMEIERTDTMVGIVVLLNICCAVLLTRYLYKYIDKHF